MISVAILAGGKSSRMGQDKAFLDIGGKTVIEQVIERVAPLTDDLFINTNALEVYKRFGLRTVPDVFPGKAALGGIYSAIHAARYDDVLVVACDMPLLNVELLRYLISLAGPYDVVIPTLNSSRPETLHAIYNKGCLPAMEAQLKANKLRIVDFFSEVSVYYVEREQIVTFDSELRSFINMNTPADLEHVKRLINIV
jgi:molybdopterin-guanine dinucleotide biosynthesis protein A